MFAVSIHRYSVLLLPVLLFHLGSEALPEVALTAGAPERIEATSGSDRDEPWGVDLAVNGGFEDGLAGWQVIAGAPVAVQSAYSMVPHQGEYFLYGGLNVSSWSFVLRQEFDLLAAGFTASGLDGGAKVGIESWLRNWNAVNAWDDQVFLEITYLGAAGRLASGQSLFGGADAWVSRPFEGLLPPGTRTLRLDVVGLWRKDNDNDSCADDISVRIVQALPGTPALTKQPMLQGYGCEDLAVVWETSGNVCQHWLEWGESEVTEQTVSAVTTRMLDSQHFIHHAEFGGLLPGVLYRYRVRSGAASSEIHEFRTPPPVGSLDCRIAWIADTQSAPATLTRHLEHISAVDANLMITVGDLLGNGSNLESWLTEWWTPMTATNVAQTVPQAMALGNHEGEDPYTYAHVRLPGNGRALPGNGSWHAFRVGPVFVALLDTNTGNDRENPDQTEWLELQLSSGQAQDALFRVVAFHMPPYSNLWYCGTQWVVDEWVELFQEYRVDLVLSGHTHDYERGSLDGVTYCIIGGGGGALENPDDWACNWEFEVVECVHHFAVMEVTGGLLRWRAYDLNMQQVDAFEIDRSPSATAVPATASPTPYVTPTATPVDSATPLPTDPPIRLYLGLSLEQPLGCFQPGDEFLLSFAAYNAGAARSVDFYCVLDVYGAYYFYPGWTPALDSRRIAVPVSWSADDLLRFDWPEGAGEASDLAFLAVMTSPGAFEPMSGIAAVTFCYRE